ncbi:hypothetical protein SDC9_184013 [bioreactor metagenome]|uniref:Uncharacterized protein n=1 Tax=bioreactor metagenome TaxID=1076179 RepID=A0A645HK39_9ZZZZ
MAAVVHTRQLLYGARQLSRVSRRRAPRAFDVWLGAAARNGARAPHEREEVSAREPFDNLRAASEHRAADDNLRHAAGHRRRNDQRRGAPGRASGNGA